MQSNIISLSGVQCSGKTTVAQHLKRLIPESVIYDGKREFKRSDISHNCSVHVKNKCK